MFLRTVVSSRKPAGGSCLGSLWRKLWRERKALPRMQGTDTWPGALWIYHLNLQTSAKPVTTKLHTLSVKQVDTEIFQMKPKLSYLLLTDMCNFNWKIFVGKWKVYWKLNWCTAEITFYYLCYTKQEIWLVKKRQICIVLVTFGDFDQYHMLYWGLCIKGPIQLVILGLWSTNPTSI